MVVLGPTYTFVRVRGWEMVRGERKNPLAPTSRQARSS